MADPFTWTMIGMGASAAGGLTSAAGAMQQSSAQAGMYGYQAGVAQLRQKIALANRDYALASGEMEARNYGIGARARMGQIKAAQGASNLDIGSGSPREVQKSQETAAGIDLATLRSNTARKAYGYEVAATEEGAQSQLYEMAAAGAKEAGPIKAAGSLLGTVSSVSDKWLQASSAGVFA